MDETFACKPKNLLEKKRIMMGFYTSLSYTSVMAYSMRHDIFCDDCIRHESHIKKIRP